MARLAGINIPDNKHTVVSLTYIYGIGNTTAAKVCDAANVDPRAKIQDLSEDDLDRIRQHLTTMTLEGDLRRTTQLSIKRLLDLGCNRGIRHRRNLPVRGQKTKNNARTRKGPKRPIRK